MAMLRFGQLLLAQAYDQLKHVDRLFAILTFLKARHPVI
jgi:hypothetical protein